jgi:Domain of unknown function (DUF5063)
LLVISDRVAEFQQAAEAYRAAVEAAKDSQPGAPYARRLRNAVARVYLAAALLDRPELDESADDPPAIDTTRSRDLEAAVRSRFGSADEFLDVWDPTEPDARDPIRRSLAQELVEIYEELGVALALLTTRDGRGGLWDIAESFEQHWGKHAVDVLRPLHHLTRLGVEGFDY